MESQTDIAAPQHIDCRYSHWLEAKLAVVSHSARARPRMTDMHGYKCVRKDRHRHDGHKSIVTNGESPVWRTRREFSSCFAWFLLVVHVQRHAREGFMGRRCWGSSSRVMYRFMHMSMYEVVYSQYRSPYKGPLVCGMTREKSQRFPPAYSLYSNR